ncbi:SUKH-4 family immunity protein [Streptomyces sp. LP05-1]|uniref:SUKH-4 family immunity protein n=1 Tax=Streptomyces pyxinae TaxID=2970734 RepID=A0ABT2CKA1_9ACTN|nr:SUKH-4 family immunity protein [Streptomyces sp. LP05-1]MCS0637848.1 SUKH-4 family immunity protein [Streptomyces sp. LP05-1]
MVTYAQAQERAEEWINGDMPAYQHREVRVREFELGFVVWAEDRPDGPVSDGGRQRLVIARDSGEVTLWPGLPVGEVIRRYEEEYGAPAEAPGQVSPAPPERIDLNQTSFLLTPPEWLQDAADRMGVPDRRPGTDDTSGAGASAVGTAGADASGVDPAGALVAAGAESAGPAGDAGAPESAGAAGTPPAAAAHPDADLDADAHSRAGTAPDSRAEAEAGAGVIAEADAGRNAGLAPDTGSAAPATGSAPAPGAPAPGSAHVPGDPAAGDGVAAPAASWDAVDARRGKGGAGGDSGDDGSVPLPATVFAPPLSGADTDDTPPPVVGPDAPTALLPGGSALPATRITPLPDPQGAAPHAPETAGAGSGTDAGPGGDSGSGTGTAAPAAGSGAGSVPGTGAGSGSGPGAAGGYVPTQLVSQLGPEGPPPPGAPAPHQQRQPAPGATGTPPPPPGPPRPPGATPAPGGDAHHAATMLARPGAGGATPPPPPGPPRPPGATPPPPGAPGVPGGGVHQAATMLAQPGPGAPVPPPGPAPAPGGTPPHGAPGMPAGPVPPPGAPPAPPAPGHPGSPVHSHPAPPAHGHPQQPAGPPTVGPGYQAVLRYRAPDGSEARLIRRSAPGTPHPEWQILHELRALNVPPQQVLELHTELESCELPGGYCARMIRETWPQARITSIAPYGRDHAGRRQGMDQLLAHQGELHQVADGPARPAPVRAPLPPVQPAPPLPPEGVAQELLAAFGPQGLCRFDQRAVSRQGVPELVARTLVWAGLPADFGPFFWAQPAHPVVPTLAELAAQRQVAAAPDAASYLVVGSDFGRALCVQYGTAHIVAVPVEAGPGGGPVAPQFVNSGLPEFTRCLALLGRMWRLRYGLTPEQAGRWTVDFQAQLAMLDPAALASPESWWSVLLEQMWDGLL